MRIVHCSTYNLLFICCLQFAGTLSDGLGKTMDNRHQTERECIRYHGATSGEHLVAGIHGLAHGTSKHWRFICSILRHFIVPWSVHSCQTDLTCCFTLNLVSLLCRHHWWSDQCDNVNGGGSEDWGWCQWIFFWFGEGIGRHSDQTCGRSFGFCLRNGTNCQRHGQPKQQVFIQIIFSIMEKGIFRWTAYPLPCSWPVSNDRVPEMVSKIEYKTETNFSKRQQQISLRLI